MPNIATVLKSEISRIARKEVRAEIEGLKKTASVHRAEIASLKLKSRLLEQELRRVIKSSPAPTSPPAAPAGESPAFDAKRLASQRKRLGLSAEACGLLLGTVSKSIYRWESGEVTPRARFLPAIAALASLSKAQAAEVVASRQKA